MQTLDLTQKIFQKNIGNFNEHLLNLASKDWCVITPNLTMIGLRVADEMIKSGYLSTRGLKVCKLQNINVSDLYPPRKEVK